MSYFFWFLWLQASEKLGQILEKVGLWIQCIIKFLRTKEEQILLLVYNYDIDIDCNLFYSYTLTRVHNTGHTHKHNEICL